MATEDAVTPTAEGALVGGFQIPLSHEDAGVVISRLAGYWIWRFPSEFDDVPTVREILDDGRAPEVPKRTSCHVIPAGREFKLDTVSNLWITGTADHVWIQVHKDGGHVSCVLISGGRRGRNSAHSLRGRCQCGEPVGAAYDLHTGEDPTAFVHEVENVIATFNRQHAGSRCLACGTPIAEAWSALRGEASAYSMIDDGRRRFKRTLPRPDTPLIHVTNSEIHDDGATLVFRGGSEVGMARVDGTPYAFRPACPHRGGPLGEAAIKNGAIVCPWHKLTFDLKTGLCNENPRFRLWRYSVQVHDGEITVDATNYLSD